MNLHLIVAMTPRRVIGKEKRLPWTMPSDIRRFRRVTMGHPLIMGSTTHLGLVASLGGPLEGRKHIVLTRRSVRDVENSDGIAVPSPEAALIAAQRFGQEIFVIGGAQVYERMLPLCRILHITRVYPDDDDKIKGDAYFPSVRLTDGGWKALESPLPRGRHHPADLYDSDYYVWGR